MERDKRRGDDALQRGTKEEGEVARRDNNGEGEKGGSKGIRRRLVKRKRERNREWKNA